MSRYEMLSARYPLLPMKNVVIFPRNVYTMLVGRSRSIQAIEEATERDRRIVVTKHRNPEIDDPRPDDLYSVGTLVEVVSVERQAGGGIQVILEGLSRVTISTFDNSQPFYWVWADKAIEDSERAKETPILIELVDELIKSYSEARNKINPEVLEMILQTEDPSQKADLVTAQIINEASTRQEFLENFDPVDRLEKLSVHLANDVELSELETRIKDRVRQQIDRNQREYYLREQLKIIHDELSGEGGNEIEALRRRVDEEDLPETVGEKLRHEIGRLERMPSVSAEGTIVRNYIDTMLTLPWKSVSEDNLDLAHATDVMNADHHALDHVKERVIEFLAVRALTAEQESAGATTILCLVGPPGVGKTSLGRSVARAMGRKFARVSLGGVRDEAEIRGHRRTYIGAYPGRIVSAIRTAGTLNPVILLDEVDKLSSDYRGDPSSALLEVLDPEQNRYFTDHFLDMPFDLSKVLFITTANQLSGIPLPLLDRLEVIEIGGYTENEKIAIGREYILPRQLEAHGVTEEQIDVPGTAWSSIIRNYTREAGVRNLERQIATLCRKVAREIVDGRKTRMRVTVNRLEDLLGPALYGFEQDFGEPLVGVAIGLGKTSVGGELVPVEVAVMPGSGTLTITGQAGEVMRESAQAALSYARSRARQLNIAENFQDKVDIHIHLPEGATPKDGPSAGITMATALISALTARPVDNRLAMTGEITLRGRVLPIGGLKEKTLAAHRYGIRKLLVPAENKRDLSRIPEHILKDVTIVWVESMDQVINEALLAVDIELQADTPVISSREAQVVDLPVEERAADLSND